MPPARTPSRQLASIPGYQATAGTRAERSAIDALPGHPLARHIDNFLTDLANANKPRNTIRAYRGDLTAFTAHHDSGIADLTAAPVRAFLSEIAGQAASTRKRKRAAVASFCRWAVRHDLLDASPMDRIDTIEVPRTLPRPAATADVAAVLDAICSRRPRKEVPVGVLRDRVLFEMAYVCGARASEVCGMYVEDLDLRVDDEHARVHGKGGTVRTVLLDDRGYVALLRLYLTRAGYTSGPLFRATVNGRGGPLSYDAAHSRWKKYCAAAGTGIGIHQLRHAHATELINSGVSIEVVRRRLGHASTETTQVYTLLADKVADAEIRAARRRRDRAAR
jgi:integrase/recombinase XerD